VSDPEAVPESKAVLISKVVSDPKAAPDPIDLPEPEFYSTAFQENDHTVYSCCCLLCISSCSIITKKL
jgi:hypothetical protein